MDWDENSFRLTMWDDYVWILVVTSLLAFFASFGIGANDVANAFATSVGAKSITLPQAILLAGIFEFAGAVLLGAHVTSTISHDIVKLDDFESTPELLMYGMLCAVAAVGLWLLLACYLELPVSTTHSTIGGIIGFAVVAQGFDSVNWYKIDYSENDLQRFKGLVPIVVSWVTSPVFSGIISSFLFFMVRRFILRKEDSLERSYKFFPILVGIACLVNIYYILLVGFDQRKVKHDGKKESISDVLGYGWASLIAWVMTIIIVIILQYTFVPWLKRRTRELLLAQSIVNLEDYPSGGSGLLESNGGNDLKREQTWLSIVGDMIDQDLFHAIEQDQTVQAVHDNSEKFDPATETAFSYLQVFTAACVSFAHGANDVANSIGPLAAVFSIYEHSRVGKSSDVPIWILILGGAGNVLGLATYGYKIIRSIGVKLVKVTPARGFAMEFATAMVITFGSIYGIPLSTTQCLVGSTTAVGMLEGTAGVNLMLLFKVLGGWIITIVIVAATTAFFFAQGIYAPSKINLDALHRYENGLNNLILTASRYDPNTTEEEAKADIENFNEQQEDDSLTQIALLGGMLSRITHNTTKT